MTESESQAPSESTPTPVKPRRGCLFYGCLGTIIAVLVLAVAMYAGFRWAIARFTDAEPMPLPRIQASAEEIQRLQSRVADFTRSIAEHRSTEPLLLSSDEANVLIQTDPNWAYLKDELFVGFESNRLNAQISVPIERFGSPRLRGRYLNAKGTFAVSIHAGELQVAVDSLEVKGRPVPESVMRMIRSRNFAVNFTNGDSSAALNKIQDVVITNRTLVIVPKAGN